MGPGEGWGEEVVNRHTLPHTPTPMVTPRLTQEEPPLAILPPPPLSSTMPPFHRHKAHRRMLPVLRCILRCNNNHNWSNPCHSPYPWQVNNEVLLHVITPISCRYSITYCDPFSCMYPISHSFIPSHPLAGTVPTYPFMSSHLACLLDCLLSCFFRLLLVCLLAF